MPVVEASCLIVGTRAHYGVAGCMCDELASSGERVELLEISPKWSRSLANRAVERVCGVNSPRVISLNMRALRLVRGGTFRTTLVTNGRELWPESVREMRDLLGSRGGGIVCYLCDDPFNPVHRRESWLESLRHYSVVVSTKRRVMADLVNLGCRIVRYARFGYHPPIHRPVDPESQGIAPMDVGFVGNADADRIPILSALVDGTSGLSVGLYGKGWSAHPSLGKLARAQVVGLAYSAAMCASTVCPCLVRRANRDGHVMRSIELPAMGAFMLAERTDEHQEIFDEGVHCEYWGCAQELVEKAKWYAQHPGAARTIAQRGYARVTAGGFTYADRALEVVAMISN
jgi:spore maturation protein CgeB